MNNESLKGLTDLELVTQYKNTDKREQMQIAGVLYERYYPLICKMKISMNNLCRQYNIPIDDSDYDSNAWDTLIKSLESVKLNKIKKENYGHWIRFHGYLRSMNRDMIHGCIKHNQMEISADITVNSNSTEDKQVSLLDLYSAESVCSSEDEFIERDDKRIIQLSLSKLKPQLNHFQSVIMSGLESGVAKNTVCADLGITPYRYNLELKDMRSKLYKELKLNGYDVSSSPYKL